MKKRLGTMALMAILTLCTAATSALAADKTTQVISIHQVITAMV